MDIMDWVLVIGTIGMVAFFFGGFDQWLFSPEKREARKAKKLFREFLKNIAEYQVHATWHVLKDGASRTDEDPWSLHTEDKLTYTGKSSDMYYFEVKGGGVARQFQIFFKEDNLASTHVTAHFEWETKLDTYQQLADTMSYVNFMDSLTLKAGGITIKFVKD